MEQFCKVTYISNAGILLEYNDSKIMIDGFCNSILPIYKNPSDETKKLMISGTNQFKNIDALLFTHNHTDHFDAESTASFLNNSKKTFMLAPSKVVMEIKQGFPNVESKRLINLEDGLGKTEDININEIEIQSISMLHDGKEHMDIRNLAYLVDIAGKRVLHVGDAKPTKENYIHLDIIHKNIDLLIAPFPYIGLPTARQVIEKYIKPRKIVLVHFPYREMDTFGWINQTMKSYLKVKDTLPETVFFENLGEFINI
ncbi:MAG TPA: MBL fold metallo-hydrolase [Clostridiaceae bacterium]